MPLLLVLKLSIEFSFKIVFMAKRIIFFSYTIVLIPCLYVLNRIYDEKSDKANADHLQSVYELLKWNFAAAQQNKLKVQNYPAEQYRI